MEMTTIDGSDTTDFALREGAQQGCGPRGAPPMRPGTRRVIEALRLIRRENPDFLLHGSIAPRKRLENEARESNLRQNRTATIRPGLSRC